MAEMEISAEDRERLAKTKFGEWFEEFWDQKFGDAFDKRVTEAYSASGRATPESGGPQAPPQASPQHSSRPRRRSLLEECFSQTFFGS